MDSSALLNLFEELRKNDEQEAAKLLFKFRCATDLQLYAAAYFPHYCKFAFNDLHRDLFDSSSFMERAIRRVRAAPRGYAKSTLETLIEPIHDVCYGLEKFIVIFSENQDQANQKLRDIRDEVLTNSDLSRDYKLRFPSRKPAETSYIIIAGDHQCLFQSYGSSTEVRGIRFGENRPSKIIVDDGEHSEEVLNEALRTKKRDWMYQVVSKLGDGNTNIKVIGTILHPESLLKELIDNPAYNGKIYKAVISWSERQDLWDKWKRIYINLDDDDRQKKAQAFYDTNEVEMLKGVRVLWPEKESYLYLMKELIETGRRAFFKEKQNEPIGGDDALFERLHYYRETEKGFLIEETNTLIPWDRLKDQNGKWLSMFGALDPATGQTKAKTGKGGDFAAIISGVKDSKQRLFVHDAWMKQAGSSVWLKKVFELNEQFQYQKFAVETNLYRDLLMPNFLDEQKRWEEKLGKRVKVPFYDFEAVDNKEKRIHTLEPKITYGWILFNRALIVPFMRQIQAFPHVDHDDGPDALEMLWSLINNRFKAVGLSVNGFGGR
jgi:predicted phage terminase large subunit-like protein